MHDGAKTPAKITKSNIIVFVTIAILSLVEGTKRSVYLRESPKMMEEPRI